MLIKFVIYKFAITVGDVKWTQEQQPPFHSHYTGQPALACTFSSELEDFVSAKFYCPHALADGNQHVQIRENTLEFCSIVLSTLSPYFTEMEMVNGIM